MTMERSDFQRLIYTMNRVPHGQLWNRRPGLEYWLVPHALSQGVGTHTEGVFAATNNGWLNTGTVIGVAGAAADFPLAAEYKFYSSVAAEMAGDRGTPSHFALDTAGDVLNSPAVFGDPQGLWIAMQCAGRDEFPSRLMFDSIAAFTAANNETGSGLGWAEDGGAVNVANDQAGAFFIDGTDFRFRNDTATSGALLTADTNTHHFRAIINRITQLIEVYIDDMFTMKGSIAIKLDEFPVSFGAGVLVTTGANFIRLGPTRIRYAWSDMI